MSNIKTDFNGYSRFKNWTLSIIIGRWRTAESVIKYNCHSYFEVWKHVPIIKYPKINLRAQKFISILGKNIGILASPYSTMKMIKSKRLTLKENHLTELLRIALTTYNPGFKKLTKIMNTQQIRY